MSATEVSNNIFTVDEDSFHHQNQNQTRTDGSPSDYLLDNLSKSTESEPTPTPTASTDKNKDNTPAATTFGNGNNNFASFSHSEYVSPISPTFMLSSMASASPATENILSSAKERLQNIRSWKDFFSLDQFRIPESTTAAQSRVSHNTSYFQNNYLIILLLLTGFSLYVLCIFLLCIF